VSCKPNPQGRKIKRPTQRFLCSRTSDDALRIVLNSDDSDPDGGGELNLPPIAPTDSPKIYSDMCQITAQELRGTSPSFILDRGQEGFRKTCHMEPGSRVEITAHGQVFPSFPEGQHWSSRTDIGSMGAYFLEMELRWGKPGSPTTSSPCTGTVRPLTIPAKNGENHPEFSCSPADAILTVPESGEAVVAWLTISASKIYTDTLGSQAQEGPVGFHDNFALTIRRVGSR